MDRSHPERRPRSAVGIVAASGGLQAVPEILAGLPREFGAPIFVVMSMPDVFLASFVARIAERCRMPVVAAEDGQVPEPGNVYVAGTERRLIVERRRLRFVACEPRVYDCMDTLFRSMARELGAGAIAVILTGLGSDGPRGMKEVREVGGHTIAQDRSTSLIDYKPRLAVELGAACESLPLGEIASRLMSLVTSGPGRSPSA